MTLIVGKTDNMFIVSTSLIDVNKEKGHITKTYLKQIQSVLQKLLTSYLQLFMGNFDSFLSIFHYSQTLHLTVFEAGHTKEGILVRLN